MKRSNPKLTADEQVFWDRIADMPDIEAKHEFMRRKDDLVLQNAMLLQQKTAAENFDVGHEIGVAMQENVALASLINSELKIINERMERLSWKSAVKAVFGEEGYLKCRQWMEMERVA